jgi:hypothetical protein
MFGHNAEVTVCAITFSEIGRVGASNFSYYFCELRAAYAEDPFIATWKGAARQENRCAGGIFERQRFQEFAYKCDLRGFFGGCGNSFAGLNETVHKLRAGALHAHRLATWTPKRSARIEALFA